MDRVLREVRIEIFSCTIYLLSAKSPRHQKSAHLNPVFAGADFVMSYASMGANTIFNLLDRSDILMVAEGLDVFKVKLPTSLAGKTLADSGIRQKTGCNVVAIVGEKKMQFNLDPHLPLPEKSDIILIGSVKAENRFLELYGNHL